MKNATRLDGVTRIGGQETGFVVWSVDMAALGNAGSARPEILLEQVAGDEASGVALDLASLDSLGADRTSSVMALVDGLQQWGVSVIAHGASGSFLTAIRLEDAHARLATGDDLTSCVVTLRDYDEMRRRCTSDRGHRMNQLRMPARPLSLAPLCLFARHRLAREGVEREVLEGLLQEAYFALSGVLEESYDPGEGDVAASVAVHDGRATITILDGGKPRENEVILPGNGARVDRIHRFRILDRHNALVLEKDLAGGVATA